MGPFMISRATCRSSGFSNAGVRTSTTLTRLDYALRNHAPIDVHPEVQDALTTRKPIVALETAIVTHGMPYPTNLETAQSVEKVVRSTGSIPATIGMIGGRIKIGLQPSELEHLAITGRNSSSVKLSPRDFMPAIALKKDGGTTCAGTSFLCSLAGIKVFSTGGLGGVHRGGENSMDISADLAELARSPVGLVSAGVKSILDIGRTLEYLETLGVPVISYGRTADFPAFFSPRSGYKAPWNTDDPETVARILHAQWQLSMPGGALIAVPIPQKYEAISAEIQESVERAVCEADENGVSKQGKEVTPWILRRVAALTQGKSLPSNIALIENTALVGGRIAFEYAKLEKDFLVHSQGENRIYATSWTEDIDQLQHTESSNNGQPPVKLIVVGSAAVDITAQERHASNMDQSLGLYSTSPGHVSMSVGGVARNISEAAHRIFASRSQGLPSSGTLLVSSIGKDVFGRLLIEKTRQLGMRTDGLIQSGNLNSAVCNMVLDTAGSLIGGVADMDIIQSLDVKTVISQIQRHKPDLVALDGNLSPDTLKEVVKYANEHDISLFFEPTSTIKSTNILPAIAASLDISTGGRSSIAFASPNLSELMQMYHGAQREPLDMMAHPIWWKVIDGLALGSEFRHDLELLARRNASDRDPSQGTLLFIIEKGIAQMAMNLLPFFQNLVIKCGELGIIVVMRISGQTAQTSAWTRKRSDPNSRCIIARGKSSEEIVVLKHYPSLALDKDVIVNVTGAGDSLVGSLLATLVGNSTAFEDPQSLDSAVQHAQRAAVLALQSHSAVSPRLSLTGILSD